MYLLTVRDPHFDPTKFIHLDTLLAQEFIAPYQEESDPSLDARLKFVLDPNRCPDCIFI